MKVIKFTHRGLDFNVNVQQIVHVSSEGGRYRTVLFSDGSFLEHLSETVFNSLVTAMTEDAKVFTVTDKDEDK